MVRWQFLNLISFFDYPGWLASEMGTFPFMESFYFMVKISWMCKYFVILPKSSSNVFYIVTTVHVQCLTFMRHAPVVPGAHNITRVHWKFYKTGKFSTTGETSQENLPKRAAFKVCFSTHKIQVDTNVSCAKMVVLIFIWWFLFNNDRKY